MLEFVRRSTHDGAPPPSHTRARPLTLRPPRCQRFTPFPVGPRSCGRGEAKGQQRISATIVEQRKRSTIPEGRGHIQHPPPPQLDQSASTTSSWAWPEPGHEGHRKQKLLPLGEGGDHRLPKVGGDKGVRGSAAAACA